MLGPTYDKLSFSTENEPSRARRSFEEIQISSRYGHIKTGYPTFVRQADYLIHSEPEEERGRNGLAKADHTGNRADGHGFGRMCD